MKYWAGTEKALRSKSTAKEPIDQKNDFFDFFVETTTAKQSLANRLWYICFSI